MSAELASSQLPLRERFKHGLNAPICLTWEVTYGCNLACAHCLSSSGKRDPRELTTAQGPFAAPMRAAALDELCAAAARTFARSIVRGMLQATAVAGMPAYRDIWPGVVGGGGHRPAPGTA